MIFNVGHIASPLSVCPIPYVHPVSYVHPVPSILPVQYESFCVISLEGEHLCHIDTYLVLSKAVEIFVVEV